MRKLFLVFAIALVMAACGGDDSGGGVTTAGGSGNGSTSSGLDPCTLAGDSVLTAYFGAPVAGEPTEAGPINGCRWRDANANSLLIQVATDYDLFRPDPCDECVDVTFGDDGYAWDSPIQSGASVVAGANWYSVTTTGFGDDAAAIAALLETVFENAGN
jgi:hypothetical protein